MGWDIFAKQGYSVDWLTAVIADEIPGFSLVSHHARSNAIGTTKRVIWDGGNQAYTYTDPAVPEGYRLSCSDNAAVQQIVIKTVDSSWATNVSTHTLTGQTATSVGSFIRAYGMKCIGPGRNDVAGTVYLSGSGAIAAGEPSVITMARAMILTPSNQALMSPYPIPAGRTGYVFNVWASIMKASGVSALAVDLELWTAGTAMPFQLQRSSGGNSIGDNTISFPKFSPIELPEKTDIELRAVCSTIADISAGFDMILVDN